MAFSMIRRKEYFMFYYPEASGVFRISQGNARGDRGVRLYILGIWNSVQAYV